MDLIPTLGELIEPPGSEQVRLARMLGLPSEPTRADFTQLFVVQLFPYASIYLNADGLAGAPAKDLIADYWKIIQRAAPPDVDHAATLLRTYGTLPELPNLTKQIRYAFFWENLASWLPLFLTRVGMHGSPFYRAWSVLTLDALEAEAAEVGTCTMLPLHLRNAPMPPSISNSGAFVDALFAPAVSGLILSRSDLGRCAQENSLTIRFADRRYTLKLMLTQRTSAVCRWLQAEAERQAEELARLPDAFAIMRDYWTMRALATAQAIGEFGEQYAVTGNASQLVPEADAR